MIHDAAFNQKPELGFPAFRALVMAKVGFMGFVLLTHGGECSSYEKLIEFP